MSSEHQVNQSFKTSNMQMAVNRVHSSGSAKVDINNLLSKIRKEKKQEKKENIIFVCLVCFAILVAGTIASF